MICSRPVLSPAAGLPLAAALMAHAGLAGASNAQAYDPTKGYTATVLSLDPIPGTPEQPAFTSGASLNSRGEVVGQIGMIFPEGFLWSPGEGMTLLQSLFEWHEPVHGTRIDDSGRIVGHYGFIDLTPRPGFHELIVFAFEGTTSGDFEPLSPHIEQTSSSATDFAGAGPAVGVINSDTLGGPRAVMWDGAEVIELGTFGSDSAAKGINSDGVVIGQSREVELGPSQGFRWTEAEGMQALPLPPDTMLSDANDINDDGYIVGRVAGMGGEFAAVWAPDGSLDALPVPPESISPQARRINGHGQILGSAMVDWEHRVLLWHEGEVHILEDYIVDLPEEIALNAVADFTDDGHILANGFDSMNFEFVTVLLTPLESSCRADVDGDGELTFFDFLAFQDLFAAGDLRADFDGDGELTFFDFLAFQDEFAAGCE